MTASFEIDNYTIQKQLYDKIAPPSQEKISKMFKEVGGWFSTSLHCDYYMLMCKEISYFTVFHFNNMDYTSGTKELGDTLKYRGQILDIRYVHEQDAYECWIKEKDTDEIRMYFLFPYDWGVVEIGEK